MAHYLQNFFNPSSIAVIGASDKPNSVGLKVFKNLIEGNFSGKLFAVNPKHIQVQGQLCVAKIKDINEPISLAIITTPAETVPSLVVECGEKGIRSIIIMSAGFSETGSLGKQREQAIIETAHRFHIQIIGPNCLGVMRPSTHMNATFDSNMAIQGQLALVSQSGALCSGILDWALPKNIGFSAIVSLGNASGIGFGDVLEYLTCDPKTKSILLYIEGIRNSRRFMSGLRAAARVKPVIIIKAGRHSQGTRAALSHTSALIGNDEIFDAALRRAGAVRVLTIEKLFLAAEILSSHYRAKGNRLLIVTNGGGAGVLAADHAADKNILLVPLDQKSLTQLNHALPPSWSHQNPIDILGDATPDRYHQVLNVFSKHDDIDGILAILVPVAMTHPLHVAKQIIADARYCDKPVLACWIGNKHVKSSWKLFEKNKIPYFNTPEQAITAFSYLADYQHNQQLLMQVPSPLSPQTKPDILAAKKIIASVLAEKRTLLTTLESKHLLQAFHIPITQTINCTTEDEAVAAANLVGYPVVMKINSIDITHKQDVDGVKLRISNEKEVRSTFDSMLKHVKEICPTATILGMTVEPMMTQKSNRELIIGVTHDKVFGPAISFGTGGSLVEIMQDIALALPPLNRFLAQQLINRTHAAKWLGPFRNLPAANVDSIISTLLRVSEMVCEFPQIQEMDINPLIANENGCVAVDARIVIADVSQEKPYAHMAIHPYPNHLISTYQLRDGTPITIRPIRPEDAEIEQELVRNLSPDSKYFRFIEHFEELSLGMLIRLTQIDYDKEMALIATYNENGSEKSIGVARFVTNLDGKSCDFALVIADNWQHKGLGTRIMTDLINIAKEAGLTEMAGIVLANNSAMLELVRHLGFVISNSEDSTIKKVAKKLKDFT